MTVEDLLNRIDKYRELAGCKDSTASLRIFNDGKRLATLRQKPRMWPETIAKAAIKLDELEASLNREAG